MGLAGQIGAGAANALDDVIVQVLAKKKFEEQIRAQQAEEAARQQQIGLAQQRLSQDASQHADVMGLRGRELDQRDTMRRDEANRAGVEDMERQAAMMAAGDRQRAVDELIGQIPEGPKRVVTGLRARGVNAPDLPDPAADEAKRRADLADYEAKKQLDLRYRPPDRVVSPRADMTPGQKFQAMQSLRRSFNAETQAAREVGMQLNQMRSGIEAAKRGDMAAGSQAVLVTFQKILDPASVVRESEYARSSAGQALLSRMQGAYERLATGGAGVPVNELERFVSLAESFAKNQVEAAGASKAQIDAIATEFGLDPSLITREVGAVSAPGGASGGAGPRVIRGPDGKLMLQR